MSNADPILTVPSADMIQRFIAIVGETNAVTDPKEQVRYLTEWRDRFHGTTPVVLKPKSAEEISSILKLANENRIGIVAQAGNTGLVGGQIPRSGASDIVVSIERMRAIRGIDTGSRTMTGESGLTIAEAQTAAEAVGLLFPLSMASEGSARIGGAMATNAGGLNVLAYGTARALALGLEVVLADGTIWRGLQELKKDNTGYDLKDLFVGSEGTLGIITAATLRLHPKPAGTATIMAGLDTLADVASLFAVSLDRAGSDLTAFEFMSDTATSFATTHVSGVAPVLAAKTAWSVLMEVSSRESEEEANETAFAILNDSRVNRIIRESASAASLTQRQAFWRLRESISEAQKFEGGSIKHDISVAPAAIPAFIEAANAIVERLCPGARPCPFGHFGDGNVHYNVSQPAGGDKTEYLALWSKMQDAVHALVAEFDGSISAEHGIGVMKREALRRYKDPAALAMMRAIKAALDPKGILNPGKVL